MSDAPRSIGQLAQLACTWEVLARKAGNVCPGREFPDLTVNDFLLSAAAIAPVLEQAPHQPLGVTILRCIKETRKVVNTNTNLGIVLLLAPLASVPLDEPLKPGVKKVLARATLEDSRNVYAAIRVAKPGGLGKVETQDVTEQPTLGLRDIMALAKDRDLIAAEYATDFSPLAVLTTFLSVHCENESVEHAIVYSQMFWLSRELDSLITRKLGKAAAEEVRERASRVVTLVTRHGRRAFREFDAWLRSDNHARNPGTTADLIAAALFVALREKLIAPTTPFTWDDHPFGLDEPEA